MLNIVPQLYRVKSYRTYRYRGSTLLVQVVNTPIDKETELGVSVLETCQNRKKKRGVQSTMQRPWHCNWPPSESAGVGGLGLSNCSFELGAWHLVDLG
jgi:hypothetical protein